MKAWTTSTWMREDLHGRRRCSRPPEADDAFALNKQGKSCLLYSGKRRGNIQDKGRLDVFQGNPFSGPRAASDKERTACRLANLLLSFFMVQKKSLYLFALQLRHQHKSVVSLSKEMVDPRSEIFRARSLLGQTWKENPQFRPLLRVFMTTLSIINFSHANEAGVPDSSCCQCRHNLMIPSNPFMESL